MTRYRKLDNRRGSIPYRDRWHTHRPPTTARSIAEMVLPAIATVAGVWVALVYVLTMRLPA